MDILWQNRWNLIDLAILGIASSRHGLLINPSGA